MRSWPGWGTPRRLRELDPVHYSILTRQIVVSRFADVDRILRDHRNFSNNLKRARNSRGIVATRKKLKPSMLALDPPDHTRLRRLVNEPSKGIWGSPPASRLAGCLSPLFGGTPAIFLRYRS